MSCPQFTERRGCLGEEKLIQRDSKEETHTHTHPDVNLSNVEEEVKGDEGGLHVKHI